ncbi:M48 family metallopeptidase [Sphingorhabdus rigui]|uniref:M48 family metallopeptidase n=1 Tax=Sphingorhabdus rigui TaxID=1282858 RepID=UPI00161D8D41|nr:M48 family metallopeptidase [Sphingorhabdus rigui]
MRLWALGILVALSTPADSINGYAKISDNMQASLLALQRDDKRVADIAWRIASRNADSCPKLWASIGVSLQHVSQYEPAYRTAAQAAFGLDDTYPSILAVAEGSPAFAAGLKPNDTVRAVKGVDLADKSRGQKSAASYDAVAAAMAALEALPERSAAILSVEREGQRLEVSVTPQNVCRSRVELAPGNAINANANGLVAQISGRLVDWVEGDDELALVIAHEMAHNLLDHPKRLSEKSALSGLATSLGLSGKAQRQMELDADRMGIIMVASAGYNYKIAPDFWARLNSNSPLASFLATSHPTTPTRRENARTVVGELDAKRP